MIPSTEKRPGRAEIGREGERTATHLIVDAAHDAGRAAGDAEIERDRGAEFERRLDELDALEIDLDRKEAAAAEQRNGQREGLVSLAKGKPQVEQSTNEGKVEARAERDVLQREDSDADGRNTLGEADVHARPRLGRQDDVDPAGR